jgi:hypothetical protein
MKFVNVKTFKRSVGKNCLHCGTPATITAVRTDTGFRLPVRYCPKHWEYATTLRRTA